MTPPGSTAPGFCTADTLQVHGMSRSRQAAAGRRLRGHAAQFQVALGGTDIPGLLSSSVMMISDPKACSASGRVTASTHPKPGPISACVFQHGLLIDGMSIGREPLQARDEAGRKGVSVPGFTAAAQ
jgi:hypothetical protein